MNFSDYSAQITLWQDRLQSNSPWRNSFRSLKDEEIHQLVDQGNVICDQCEILVNDKTRLDKIHSNRFKGTCFLLGAEIEIYQTTLENSVVLNQVSLNHCSLIQDSVLYSGVSVESSRLTSGGENAFGNRITIDAGLETGGRRLPVWATMTLEEALEGVHQQENYGWENYTWQGNLVEREAVIENVASLRGAFIGPGTKIIGALEVFDSAVLCESSEPTKIGPGVILRRSIVQWGVHLDSGAYVEDSALLEHSGAEKQVKISGSLLGPGTKAAEGEITACLLGPFVGFHHQSLLIAAWWPEGRGNVAYGANVGSNHTSRLPDQEFKIGEGVFFGLGTKIKYPSNFLEAPYTIVATGVTTLPQRLCLPFSLIVEGKGGASDIPPGYNRVLPGWSILNNTYMLLRNEKKYSQRNKARRHNFDFSLHRREIVELLWKTCEALEDLPVKAVYTEKDWMGIGKNYLLRKDLEKALEAYRFWIELSVLDHSCNIMTKGERGAEEWVKYFFPKLELEWSNKSGNARRYIQHLDTCRDRVLESQIKDEKRGLSIHEDYLSNHPSAQEDPFYLELKETISEKKQNLEFFL